MINHVNRTMKTAHSINKYNQVGVFYFLSTLFSWLFWVAAGYISHLPSGNVLLVSILGLAGLFAPMFVVWWMVRGNNALKKDIAGRFFNFKHEYRVYYWVACLILLTSIVLAQAVSLLFGYSPEQFVITGEFSFTSGVLPTWFMLLLAPVIEELAWHTYGTDALRQKFNLFTASMIFGAFWALWHIPLSLIKGYYQSNVVLSGWIYSANFLVSIIPFVLIMNWLYYKTERNILVVIVYHVSAGFFNEIFATHPDSKVIQTVLLLIFSVVLVIKEKDFFFKKEYLAENTNSAMLKK